MNMNIKDLNRLHDEDEDYRDQKRRSQDPNDQAWVAADNRHAEATFEAKRLEDQQANPGLRAGGDDLNRNFDSAQALRAELAMNEPEAWDKKGRAAWEQKLNGFTESVDQDNDRLKQWAGTANPEQITHLQDQINQQHEAGQDALRERRSRGLLPSEKEEEMRTETLSMDQKIDQANSVPAMSASRIRERRGEQDDGSSQGQSRGPTTWAEHVAGSPEAAEDDRKLQERQHQFVQDNGRWAKGGEIEKIEAADKERETRKRTQ